MLRHSLRTLAVAAVAACTLGPVPAAAVTLVSACQPLDKAGETYVLTANITAPSDCFEIKADRITLDLAGKTITGSGGGAGVGFIGGDFTSTVVKNGTIVNFFFGIFLPGPRNTVRNVTVSDNTAGIGLGLTSLVKDCIVQRNSTFGISASNGTQVEGCTIGGPDGDGNGDVGLGGGDQRILATRNTVIGNGGDGIFVGPNSTVTHNIVTDNGGDGIAVGVGSLVSRNTSNDNGDDGIQADCRSTITHNTATGNEGENFNPIGQGCVVLHNNFTDPE